MFVSRQSEKLRSLCGVGCLPVIDNIGPNTAAVRDTHTSVSTHTLVHVPVWVLGRDDASEDDFTLPIISLLLEAC